MIEPVAVIGLGAMGLPMASCLAGEFDVVAFDPAEERAEWGRAAGINIASSPAEAARTASTVLLITRDRAQTESALFGASGVADALDPGAVVILASTIGPDAARAIGGRLDRGGVHLVDAPVSGGPTRAGSGDLLIVVGADDIAYAAAQTVLRRLGSPVVHVGPRVGDGQLMKVINQLLAGIHIAAAAEAIALARAVGLDAALVVPTLSAGAAQSFMLEDRGPRMVQTYAGDVEVRSRVDIFVKDMALVVQTAEGVGVSTAVARAAEQLFARAQQVGLGASDDSNVVTMLSTPGPAMLDENGKRTGPHASA